eukprot:8662974-Pyramimonas_sp.AAC.1
MSRELCERVAEIGAEPHAGGATGAFRWSSRWGHEACEWCARVKVESHASAATGALGEAPCGVTKRMR